MSKIARMITVVRMANVMRDGGQFGVKSAAILASICDPKLRIRPLVPGNYSIQ
jgi:hypothetical protein